MGGDGPGKGGKKGKKPQPPKLPPDAPPELKDFVSCKAATTTLKAGNVSWIPKLPEVKLTFEANPDGSITITLKWGPFNVSVPVTVKDGKLSVDTSKFPDFSPFSDAKKGAQDWVDRLNAWLAANGQQLGQLQLQAGDLTLSKVAAAAPGKAAGAAPPPGQKSGLKVGTLLGGILMATGVGVGLWTVAQDGGSPGTAPAGMVAPSPSPSGSAAEPSSAIAVRGHEFHDEAAGNSFVVVCVRGQPNTPLDITVITPTGKRISATETTDEEGLIEGDAEITGIGPGTYHVEVIDPATGDSGTVDVTVGEEEGEPGCAGAFA